MNSKRGRENEGAVDDDEILGDREGGGMAVAVPGTVDPDVDAVERTGGDGSVISPNGENEWWAWGDDEFDGDKGGTFDTSCSFSSNTIPSSSSSPSFRSSSLTVGDTARSVSHTEVLLDSIPCPTVNENTESAILVFVSVVSVVVLENDRDRGNGRPSDCILGDGK